MDERRRVQARARRLAKRAETLAGAGRVDEAILCQSQLVDLCPDDGRAVLRLGMLYRSACRFDAAVTAFRSAKRLCPQLSDPREALMETLLDAAEFTEAVSEGKALIKMSPNNIFARDVLTVAYMYLGRIDKALLMTMEMIRFDPLNPSYHFKRAILLHQKGDIATAVGEYERVCELSLPETEIHTDAEDAIMALDDFQIRQIRVLAGEDRQFFLHLCHNPAAALGSRGFVLSTGGLVRAEMLVTREALHAVGGITPLSAWGGPRFYH